MPVATNLAAVYPPPEWVLRKIESLVFKFLWGTNNFPLAWTMTYRKIDHGGLELPGLGPIFLANFMSFNFGRWAQLELQEKQTKDVQFWLVAFAKGWMGKEWGNKWWKEGMLSYRVTQTKNTGPDYMGDVNNYVKKFQIYSEWLKQEDFNLQTH